MGVIQSGINQAIQTAAIIGQLQEIPQKKAERKITTAELDKIEKEKDNAKEFFSAIKDEKTLADQQELKDNLWTPEAKQYYSDLRDKEISLRDRYQKAGGKEGKYLPEHVDPQDKASEISLEGKWPGYNSLEYEYGIPTITDEQLEEEKKQNFNIKKAQMANTMAQSQREIYNQMTNLFKKFDTEGYNGK